MNETQTDGSEEPSVTGIEAPGAETDKYYDQLLLDEAQKRTFFQRPVFLGVVAVIIVFLAAVGLNIMNHNAKANALRDHPAIVDITSQGFDPATVIISKGQSVKWINTDAIPHQPVTNPFPLEDGLPGFRDPRPLTINESYTYTFSQVGTFGYHDHLDPFQLTGKVVVH